MDFRNDALTGAKFIPEDYAFSHRWRSIGGQIWIDVNSKLNHEGSYIFRGDFRRHLQEKQALADARAPFTKTAGAPQEREPHPAVYE